MITPTTKAQEGHDEDVPIQELREKEPGLEEFLLRIGEYQQLHAAWVDLLFLDDKLEVGRRKRTGELVLGDEVGTGDSSRIVCLSEFKRLWPGALPGSLDKEPMRRAGREFGIDKLDPKIPINRLLVQDMLLPSSILRETTARYHHLFERMTQMTLPDFWEKKMGIPAD